MSVAKRRVASDAGLSRERSTEAPGATCHSMLRYVGLLPARGKEAVPPMAECSNRRGDSRGGSPFAHEALPHAPTDTYCTPPVGIL